MKTTIRVLILVLCGATGLAQTFPVVVPGGLANTEGNSSMTEPLNSPSFRMQMVFDASQFGFLGSGTGRIDSIAFRIDGAATGGAGYSFGGSTIQLSTTQSTPDSLSPVFSENIGSDAKTVWNNALGIGRSYSPGQTPQPFNGSASSLSFLYSPARGNLLIDIIGTSGEIVFPGGLDAQGTVGDGVSRVFGNSELLASGTLDSLGLVTRFQITIVPEPPVSLVAVLGALVLAIGGIRRSR